MPATHTRAYDKYAPVLVEYAALDPGDPRRAGLRDRLVRGFHPVARHIAVRYARRGEPVDDLEQVAAIGLLHAIDRYDPTAGNDFLSYAVPTMMGEVRRHFRDASWSIRTPRGVKDRYLEVGAAIADFSQRTGRSPTMVEIAEQLGRSVAEVHEAYSAGNSYRPDSLDRALVDADDTTLLEVIGRIDSRFDEVDTQSMVRALVERLPVRERRMLTLRFVHEQTQREIAKELCISQMHVSRLLTRTLGWLREQIEADREDDAGRLTPAG